MRLRLSIFSFSAVQFSLRPTLAAIAACVIVVGFNFIVSAQIKSGNLFVSSPQAMLEEARQDYKNSVNGVWWVGNSTLAAGIDSELMSTSTRTPNGYTKLGSATLEVTVKLAERMLSSSDSAPKKIFFLFTKDDLNKNGDRAFASKKYLSAFERESFEDKISGFFPVYAARFALLKWAEKKIVSTFKVGNEIEKKVNENFKDISNDFETTYLQNLGKNFAPHIPDFSYLGLLAKRRNVEIYFVLPPTASAVQKWQKKYASSYPWRQIKNSINASITNKGLFFLDYSNLFPSSTEYFKDVYHLNKNGSNLFTQQLLEDVFE